MFTQICPTLFQTGGLLGFGLIGHPGLLGCLLVERRENAAPYVLTSWPKTASDHLARVEGTPANLHELYVEPTLASMGVDLSSPEFVTGKRARWMKEKIQPETFQEIATLEFVMGAAIGYHHPELFRRCWEGTTRKRPESEWEEAYRYGIVSTPAQSEPASFSEQVGRVLQEAADWALGAGWPELTDEDLEQMKALAKQATRRLPRDSNVTATTEQRVDRSVETSPLSGLSSGASHRRPPSLQGSIVNESRLADHVETSLTDEESVLDETGEGQGDGLKGHRRHPASSALAQASAGGRVSVRSQRYVFVGNWGREGRGDGEFNTPVGIAVDLSDHVYVTDRYNGRIQKFTSDGMFVTKWGSRGTGDGQFREPHKIAVDDQGYVYVNDAENHRIQKFTSDGQFLAKWGWKSTAKKKAIRDGAFNYPMGIAVDGEGNIYVVDSNRMQRFNDHGMFVSKWGNWTWEFTGSNWNDSPTGDGEFVHPNGLAVDGVGNIYVVDSGNDRIQKFAADGTFLAKWGSRGIGDGEFQMPEGLAIDSSGNVYVTDFYMGRVEKFTSNGTFLAEFGTDSSKITPEEPGRYRSAAGSGDGELKYPTDVAVDRSGIVFVVDAGNHRIQRFEME